ncbi:MAG: ECF transporter S component [Ruminococcaceae bacterium]|nr:ECF transporter S component [Oscillospiraceae bacterium]
MSNKKNKKVFNLTIVGLMTAIATVIYMVFPEVPIVPGVDYMKVDFSDFPAILTGVIFGPVQGILVEVFKNLIHLTRTTTFGIGEIMNIVIGSSMILSMSYSVKTFKKIFKSNKINLKIYFISSAITIIIAIVMGWIANLVFTPIFYNIMGIPLVTETYLAGVWGSTTLNSIKAIFNILPFFPIYFAIEKGVKKYTI